MVSLVGDTHQFTAQEQTINCFGGVSSFYNVTPNWSSDDTNVATINSSGYATTVGAGDIYLWGTWQGFTYDPHFGDCAATPVDASPFSEALVRPKVAGSSTLWWFGGENPVNYSTTATLTAFQTGTAASYTWEIISGTDQLRFDDNSTSKTTSSAQVSVKTIGFSTNTNQIGVKVTVNGISSATFQMTSLTPYSLDHVSTMSQDDSSRGYVTTITYRILDQFGNLLPSNVEANENFTTGFTSDYTGENWSAHNTDPNGATVSPSGLGETIAPPAVFIGIVPAPSFAGTGTVSVMHRSQELRIGSTSIGSGRRVQSNTQRYYRDHGAHENIVSPSS